MTTLYLVLCLLFLFISSSYSTLPSPYLYVNFEGNALHDLSTNAFTVALLNTTQTAYTTLEYNSTKQGYSYHHSTSKFIKNAITTNAALPQSFTVSIWFYAENSTGRVTSGSVSTSDNEYLITPIDATEFTGNVLSFVYQDYYLSYGTDVYMSSGPNIYTQTNSYVVNRYQWNHIAMTYDFSSNTGAAYLNAQYTGSTNPHLTGGFSTTNNIVFGGCVVCQNSPDQNTFVGYIDEIRIYNQALTSSQITELYSLPFATTITTSPPTTLAPTTLAPTTLAPTTLPPTTLAPTTVPPTTVPPTTLVPATLSPTTTPPTTVAPTLAPTTVAPTTLSPTTLVPTTLAPTTVAPTTVAPTTLPPTTLPPTTMAPTTLPPTTSVPTTNAPTNATAPTSSSSSLSTSSIITISVSSVAGVLLAAFGVFKYWYQTTPTTPATTTTTTTSKVKSKKKSVSHKKSPFNKPLLEDLNLTRKPRI